MSRKKDGTPMPWENRVVTPQEALRHIEPGMKIFLGTGVAEPRTLVKHLMASDEPNLQDLELIQLVSLGDVITMKELQTQKFRLKTFFSGWVASEAITQGYIDMIPSRFRGSASSSPACCPSMRRSSDHASQRRTATWAVSIPRAMPWIRHRS